MIGVGANLGSRVATIRAAIELLRADAATAPVAVSPVYESAAIGPAGPPYLNLAIRVRSSLELDALWERLARIESELGRVRRERWASRTLDLDILWCGASVTGESLRVPHPELERRWFALAPLLDVAPEARAAYASALDALGGAPVAGQPLDALTQTRVSEAGGELHVESSARDRADALAEALGAFGRARRGAAPDAQARAVHAVHAQSAEGDELGAFVRAVLALARRGLAPVHVTLCALADGQADGRVLAEPAPLAAWALARATEAPEPPGHRVGLAFSRRITEG